MLTSDATSSHPCSHRNGGCEHICLPSPHGPRCACLDGFNIVNGTRCSFATCEYQYLTSLHLQAERLTLHACTLQNI